MKLHFVLDDQTSDDDAFCMIGWAKAASIRHDVTVHMPKLRIWWELRCSIYSLRIEDLREEYDGVVFARYPGSKVPRTTPVIGCVAAYRGDWQAEEFDYRYTRYACLRAGQVVGRPNGCDIIPWAIDFDIFHNDGNSWHKGRKLSWHCGGGDRAERARLADIPKRHELLALNFVDDGDLVLAHEGPAFGAIPVVTHGNLHLSPNPETISLDCTPLLRSLTEDITTYYTDRPEELALRQRSARSFAFAMHSHRKVFDDIDRLLRKVEGR